MTYRGRTIARLVSVQPREPGEAEGSSAQAWAALDQLAAEIGACWPASVSAAEAVREQRGES